MTEQVATNIFRIQIPLPENPLKNLNSYVIKTPERNLIIDTGFNRPECLEALQNGIQELNLDMERTDLFITHFHADHVGLVGKIASPGSKIYMGSADVGLFREIYDNGEEHWRGIQESFLAQGYPMDVLRLSMTNSPIRIYTTNQDIPFTEVFDGQMINLGKIALTCIHTPGHTPGHTCLYWAADKILFSGDHVLFDITPNITAWSGLINTLDSYMESLNKVKKYEIATTFAAHRKNGADVYTRIDQLLAHHKERLDELLSIIKNNPGINGYDAAAKMKWSIRCRGWDDFPPAQKYFAVGEAMAHLIYLERDQTIRRTVENGVCMYTAD